MIVTVTLHGCLRKYADGQRQVGVKVEPGTTIETLAEQIGVPRRSVSIVSVNDVLTEFEIELKEGDRVTLFAYVAGG